MLIKTYFVDRIGDHSQKEVVFNQENGDIAVFESHGGNAQKHIQDLFKYNVKTRLVSYDERGVATWEVTPNISLPFCKK